MHLVEGNPGHKSREDLARGLRLPPVAPPEPDWSVWLVAAEVLVPRRRANESAAQRRAREGLAAQRRAAREDVKAARVLASSTWRHVVKVLDSHGVLATLDAAVLTDLCVAEARLLQCEREVGRHGLRQLGERGWQRNGATTIAAQYRTHLRWLWAQLGMSPLARDAMSMAPLGADPDDDQEDFDV